jgi:pyruvate dehydrogenase phosphatase
MISETEYRTWNFEVLTTSHNGANNCEVQRVRNEHPGEPGCVIDGRVLGAIAPFRC